MNHFTVTTQQHPDRTTITVTAETDLQTCGQLAQAAFVIPLSGKPLYLDLTGVSFMDSSGLNLLGSAAPPSARRRRPPRRRRTTAPGRPPARADGRPRPLHDGCHARDQLR
ncbi:STAS domain-containing protein [Streptomyces sp. NPDC059468]|uniref:STAS domain-containing protein n=1 Tax=unclassified Streptomyces TaxID=2593676 RepID=UPI0036B9FABE